MKKIEKRIRKETERDDERRADPRTGQDRDAGLGQDPGGAAAAQSIDDFFGREGIFAWLFSKTLEQMLEAELTAHLGYDQYEAKGRHFACSHCGEMQVFPDKQ